MSKILKKPRKSKNVERSRKKVKEVKKSKITEKVEENRKKFK